MWSSKFAPRSLRRRVGHAGLNHHHSQLAHSDVSDTEDSTTSDEAPLEEAIQPTDIPIDTRELVHLYLERVAQAANNTNMAPNQINPTNNPYFWVTPDYYEIGRQAFHRAIDEAVQEKILRTGEGPPDEWKSFKSDFESDAGLNNGRRLTGGSASVKRGKLPKHRKRNNRDADVPARNGGWADSNRHKVHGRPRSPAREPSSEYAVKAPELAPTKDRKQSESKSSNPEGSSPQDLERSSASFGGDTHKSIFGGRSNGSRFKDDTGAFRNHEHNGTSSRGAFIQSSTRPLNKKVAVPGCRPRIHPGHMVSPVLRDLKQEETKSHGQTEEKERHQPVQPVDSSEAKNIVDGWADEKANDSKKSNATAETEEKAMTWDEIEEQHQSVEPVDSSEAKNTADGWADEKVNDSKKSDAIAKTEEKVMTWAEIEEQQSEWSDQDRAETESHNGQSNHPTIEMQPGDLEQKNSATKNSTTSSECIYRKEVPLGNGLFIEARHAHDTATAALDNVPTWAEIEEQQATESNFTEQQYIDDKEGQGTAKIEFAEKSTVDHDEPSMTNGSESIGKSKTDKTIEWSAAKLGFTKKPSIGHAEALMVKRSESIGKTETDHTKEEQAIAKLEFAEKSLVCHDEPPLAKGSESIGKTKTDQTKDGSVAEVISVEDTDADVTETHSSLDGHATTTRHSTADIKQGNELTWADIEKGYMRDEEESETLPTSGWDTAVLKTDRDAENDDDLLPVPTSSKEDSRTMILRWMQSLDKAYPAEEVYPTIGSEYLLSYGNSVIAPRQWTWYPPIGDKKQRLEVFWESYQKMAPERLDAADLITAPWWRTYKHEKSSFLIPFEHPDPDPRLDPFDFNYKIARSKATTAKHKSDEEIKKKRKVSELQLRLQSGPINNQARIAYRPPTVPSLYQTKANCYIRLASESDLLQIKNIWNHFISDSFYLPDRTPLTDGVLRSRFQNIQNKEWPWLVAVERSRKNLKRRKDPARLLDLPAEKILGFAFADDYYGAMDSAFRFTATSTVVVASDCRGIGVGKTLLDRLLFCLESSYQPKCQVDYFATGGFMEGPVRKVHRIVASFQYAPQGGDEARCKWMTAWLEDNDFVQAAEFEEVACRKNLSLNLRFFVRKCANNQIGFHSEVGDDDNAGAEDPDL